MHVVCLIFYSFIYCVDVKLVRKYSGSKHPQSFWIYLIQTDKNVFCGVLFFSFPVTQNALYMKIMEGYGKTGSSVTWSLFWER